MQPHDHLFRHVFSQPEHAAGELQAVLPAPLSAHVDWSTLALIPGSFVDPSLHELRSDLLFSATLSGRRVLFYVLLEHQSSSDPFMPLRLLGYMMRIWEHERREHPEARRLPAIIPVVVSHDDAGWSAPTSFAELLDLPPELRDVMRPQMVDFEMLLDDLSKARDDDLLARAKMTAIGLLTLFFLARARTSEDFVGELMKRIDLLREVVSAPNGFAALAAFLRYASMVTDTPAERLRVVAQALGPKSEVVFMSAAEEWMMEGRAQGEAKGKAEGKAEAVLSVLEARGLAVSVAERERIAKCTDLALLDRWLRRVATVATVAEVLAD
jgi:predicted transposase YdaD